MTEKQINKWLRRRFSGLCWALIGYWVLMNLLVYAAMVVDMIRQSFWNLAVGDFSFRIDYDAVFANGWGYVTALIVGFLILLAWKGGGWFREEALRKEQPMRPGVFFPVMLLCMGSQMVNTLWVSVLEWLMNLGGQSLIPMLEQVSGSTGSFSMFLYSGIFAPVMEEVLFRGLIFRGLRPCGKRFAIFGSGLLFGLFHGNLIQTPYAILMGLILGWITAEYSLVWSVALHVFNNLVLAEGLGRLMQLVDPLAAQWLNLILFGTGALASCVILLRNRRKIADYRRSEWMDRRCIKCLFTNSGFAVLALITVFSMATMLFSY